MGNSAPKKILIIGATSALAHEAAKHFAADKSSFVLLARSKSKLKIVADDLRQRGAEKVVSLVMDVNDHHRHVAVFTQAITALGGLDLGLLAHGTACDILTCEQDMDLLEQEIRTNFVSTTFLLMRLADYFEKQRRGTIAVITSVAGDRGRREQYVYAACKAAVTVLLQGLRQRLYPANVSVVTLKPGLVDTPLTAHLTKGPLYSSPQRVGRGIYRAICDKKEEAYLPWFWKYVMLLLQFIPEALFKRLRTLVK